MTVGNGLKKQVFGKVRKKKKFGDDDGCSYITMSPLRSSPFIFYFKFLLISSSLVGEAPVRCSLATYSSAKEGTEPTVVAHNPTQSRLHASLVSKKYKKIGRSKKKKKGRIL